MPNATPAADGALARRRVPNAPSTVATPIARG